MRRPNIILFNPDQWRGDVLGHLGNPAAVTPNLDRMVAHGAVSFSAAFCQNPVCMPSRCSFLTGIYPHTWGHTTFTHMLHPERGEPNLLKELKDSGYRVWWSGKNDVIAGQVPEAEALSCSIRFKPGPEDYRRLGLTCRPRYTHDWRGAPGSDTFYSFFAGRLDTGGEAVYGDRDWADVLEAISFIERHDPDSDAPFCLFLALENPHPDYGVEDPWFSRIDRSLVPERVGRHSDGEPAAHAEIRRCAGMDGWTEERWRELRAVYYGMCAKVDHQLGLVLDALSRKNLEQDTAVICFSDHGDYTGDYGLVQKSFVGMEDCLLKVPLVIQPPRSWEVSPRVCEELVELVDLTETVYDLAGIQPSYRRFGRSLRPLISGAGARGRSVVFAESGYVRGQPEARQVSLAEFHAGEADSHPSPYWPSSRLHALDEPIVYYGKVSMARNRRYKLVQRLYEGDALFDLEADPAELRNRITDPGLAAIRESLSQDLRQWRWETESTVPFSRDSRF